VFGVRHRVGLSLYVNDNNTLRVTQFIFQSKHAAISDVYEQFNIACQCLFLYRSIVVIDSLHLFI